MNVQKLNPEIILCWDKKVANSDCMTKCCSGSTGESMSPVHLSRTTPGEKMLAAGLKLLHNNYVCVRLCAACLCVCGYGGGGGAGVV